MTYGYNTEYPSEWAEEGPFRFYFTEAYDPKTNQVVNLPTHAKNIGISGKGKGIFTILIFSFKIFNDYFKF